MRSYVLMSALMQQDSRNAAVNVAQYGACMDTTQPSTPRTPIHRYVFEWIGSIHERPLGSVAHHSASFKTIKMRTRCICVTVYGFSDRLSPRRPRAPRLHGRPARVLSWCSKHLYTSLPVGSRRVQARSRPVALCPSRTRPQITA